MVAKIKDAAVAKNPLNVASTTITLEGKSFVISAELRNEAKAAIAAQAGVSDKYLRSEPGISAAFGAPDCYTSGTVSYQALVQFLSEVHPNAVDVSKGEISVKDAEKAGSDNAALHRIKAGLKYHKDAVLRDVKAAIRAYKTYFESGAAGERKQKEKASPQKLILELADRMGKFDPAKTVEVDYVLAQAMVKICTAIIKGGNKQAQKMVAVIDLELPAAGARITKPTVAPVRELSKEEIAAMQEPAF